MNPTIFEVVGTREANWVASSSPDYRKTMAFVQKLKSDGLTLFASFYRPGEIFDEEVFVCPGCVHATGMGDCVYEEPFKCKYCGARWVTDAKKGTMWVEFDEE